MKKVFVLLLAFLLVVSISKAQTLPSITSAEVFATVPDMTANNPTSIATIKIFLPSIDGADKVNISFLDGTSMVLYSEQSKVASCASLKMGGSKSYVLKLKISGPSSIYSSTLKIELEDADGNKGAPYSVAVN